jgi:hypothetical protein
VSICPVSDCAFVLCPPPDTHKKGRHGAGVDSAAPADRRRIARRSCRCASSTVRPAGLACVTDLRSVAALGYPQPLPLNFSPYITFLPIFPPIFSSPAAVPPKYSPIPHYNYKISFSISTINFLSTNNYSYTHSTVFRVMNSDTLDLGREKEPTRRGRCREHRCSRRVTPTDGMQGEPLRTALDVRCSFRSPESWLG